MNKAEADFRRLSESLRKASHGFSISYQAAHDIFVKEDARFIAAFWNKLGSRIDATYRWDVLAVGAIAFGRIDADDLLDYQIWLVLQGDDVYNSVLQDPRRIVASLRSDVPPSRLSFLNLRTAAENVYEAKTGEELADMERSRPESGPEGKKWSWRDLRQMHPGLWDEYFVKRDRRAFKPDLASTSDQDLIVQAAAPLRSWVDVYSDPDHFAEQYKVLSEPQRALHGVTWMTDEVANGGYDQFMHNATGIVAPNALEGLRLFGADDQHAALARVIAAFPGGAPSRDRGKRQAQMAQRWKGKSIDEEFQGPTKWKDLEALEARVAKYIRAHPEEFFRPK